MNVNGYFLKVYNWREITCMEVTFTVSKWDEKQLMIQKRFPY